MTAPLITVPHVAKQNDLGDICFAPMKSELFLRLMDTLYAPVLSGSLLRSGTFHCLWHCDGRFIGSMVVRKQGNQPCVASIRKNPWLKEEAGEELILRGFLALSHHAGAKIYVGKYSLSNYAIMRFAQKVGVGASLSHGGSVANMAEKTDHSVAVLSRIADRAKQDYSSIAARAKSILLTTAGVNPNVEADVCPSLPQDVIRYSVVLS